jgi:hypothetical protein
VFNKKQKNFEPILSQIITRKKAQTINKYKQTMKIHFLLLALLAFVALSQHNVDARLHDPALRRLTEHRLLDELLHRRMEALEEMESEQGSFPDGLDLLERRLGWVYRDGPVTTGECCILVLRNNIRECSNCPNGHRYTASCGTTRRCK